MDDDELYPIEELHQEIMATKALNSDLDYSFYLQMQEAITSSLVLQPSPSHSPPKNDTLFEEEDAEFDYTDLLLEDLKRLDQERRDYKECEVEGRKMKEVTGVKEPRQSCIATLVQQVASRQREFIYCEPSLVGHNDIKFAYKLARDAITSQLSWPTETSEGKSFKETCVICYDDVNVEKMFSVDDCYHRYCFSCMKQHVEVKLHNGMVAKCPSQGCQSEVQLKSCKKFLDHKLVEVMSQRIKEASIAVTEKVYCPYPKCSTLMSKTEVLKYTKQIYVGAEQTGARACMSCHYYFCINCRVPWHYNMNCADYRKSAHQPSKGDAKLKSLAKTKHWRQCVKCSHMVELAEGCYHITCRCGYEFCYTCGAEWKKKKRSCSCPLWDESNIIRI